ncbi:MAG TPA: DUF2252 domain-containing protein [Acidimicrobiia bacterium]
MERGRDELRAAGRAVRESFERDSFGDWRPSEHRDPLAILERQAATRIPELVPLRYGRMLESPFAFFRGAAAVMACDLAGHPATGIRVQACGDAHLLNFGVFATAERRIVFDVNDFDETHPGPWEWDLARLAASVVLAARSRGFTTTDAQAATEACVVTYARTLAQLAKLTTLGVWYADVTADEVLEGLESRADRKAARRLVAKARTKDARRAFEKLTIVRDGRRTIIDDPPWTEHTDDFDIEHVLAFLEGYRSTLSADRAHLLDQFTPVDAARKVVGVGSVGTRCAIAIGVGTTDDDPLVLQVKEAEASVLEPHVGRSIYTHHGRRVVEGQTIMQAAGDPLLGWSAGPGGRDYYVRQLWDMKGSIRVERTTPRSLVVYSELCAAALARAHARSVNPSLLAGYCGGGARLARGFHRFAEAYADQTERDHAELTDAARSGLLAVA